MSRHDGARRDDHEAEEGSVSTTRRPQLRADVLVRITGGEFAGRTGTIVSAFTDGSGRWFVCLPAAGDEDMALAWIKRTDMEHVPPVDGAA